MNGGGLYTRDGLETRNVRATNVHTRLGKLVEARANGRERHLRGCNYVIGIL